MFHVKNQLIVINVEMVNKFFFSKIIIPKKIGKVVDKDGKTCIEKCVDGDFLEIGKCQSCN